ncbi:PAS domain S-box protein [Caldimonas sp. KR1-144]|uniref:PAS domain S-box protein n=1 Tax=Caldimonas sp. KR1-144 TaxID=3400911 RepID=UPI003C0232F4
MALHSGTPSAGRDSDDRDDAIRRRAEARVAAMRSQVRAGDERARLDELMRELAAHQIELEIQNERLRETQIALEASRDRYVDLYEQAPVGYVTTDTHAVIVECNRLADAMLGDRSGAGLVNRPLADFLEPDEHGHFLQALSTLLHDGGQQSIEVQVRRHPPESTRWLTLRMSLADGHAGSPPQCHIAMLDITRRVEMQESAARLAAIVASSEDAIISRDLAGRITSWNAAATRLFGYLADEMIGKTMDAMVPLERRGEEAELLRRLRNGESVSHLESERLGRDGMPAPISISLSPIREQRGVTGSALIARDISERRRADRALHKRLRQLDALSYAGQALIMGERDIGRLRNALFERVRLAIGCEIRLDYAFGEDDRLALLSSHGLSGEQEAAMANARLDDSLCGSVATQRSQLVVQRLQSSEMPQARRLKAMGVCSYAGFPLIAQDRCFGVAAFASTTREHLHEDDIQVVQAVCDQVSAMLERERLMDELHASELSLKRADRAKDDFIATLAHELRNPLAPIRNAASIMRHSDGGNLQQLAWCRDVIDRQLAQMTQLLEDLLDVSRLTRNMIELRRDRMPLMSAIEQALETAQPLLDERGHRLALDLPEEPVFIYGDLTRLTQVFANLLNNAAKYTDPGGVITLSVRRHEEQVRISVQDSGIGIEPHQLPKVFDMFAQLAPARARSGGGLGIGLALARGLVEMHGGSMEAYSDGIGRGSEFVVRLPIAAVARPRAAQAPQPDTGADAPPRRLVVADDNIDAAQTLSMVLSLYGHEVRTVFGGNEAFELIRDWQPDIAVVDIGMKDLDGYALCRKVRQLGTGRQPVMIACTGWGQEEDLRRGREAGFDFHLVKPLEPETLVRLVASARRPPRGAPDSSGTGTALAAPEGD